ncbi:hypothetical protein RMSM_02518 [Rhodopirellula maiorica SM1]|uniref:Uncharacterized protein n=1 Tax=Rhodopirellula maiorica SM1 TaxID=1265738 RepID=M5RYS5_9BACT|nr:hypothetical protein RMSM_02518 [Rhodopirellula maiorica SM1]
MIIREIRGRPSTEQISAGRLSTDAPQESSGDKLDSARTESQPPRSKENSAGR